MAGERGQLEKTDNLIVRNDRLGDAILALPSVTVLKSRFPESKVHFWTSPSVAPLARCIAGIGEVVVSPDSYASEALTVLKNLSIGTAFCFRATFSNALTLWKSGIPTRVGTSRRWYSFLFNRRINLKRRGIDRHEADLNLDLLTAAGISGLPTFPELILPQDAYNSAVALLSVQKIHPGLPLIILHPGSGGSSKEWPAQHFRSLALSMSKSQCVNIVVTGSDDEMDKCSFVSGEEFLNLCGKTNLLTIACIIKKADLMVSNSTGVLHLAVALGIPVVGLYSPVADCLPSRWGPYGHPEQALMPELPLCRNCRPGAFSSCACMEKLTPNQVEETVISVLQK